MSTTAQIQADTLQRFIAGWRAWTMEPFFANFSDDFSQKPLPLSAMQPSKNRQELIPVLTSLMRVLTNFKLTVHNTIHDPTNGTAALYILTEADTPIGPYRNEQAVFLWFNSTGDKVQRLEELFDTAFMKEFVPKFTEYMHGVGRT
ncbi:hypothetical protein E4U21_001865 [Claviceps maximensis]|nr:hypothetical protein E4U21_001865 [Claviceps maximensis]